MIPKYIFTIVALIAIAGCTKKDRPAPIVIGCRHEFLKGQVLFITNTSDKPIHPLSCFITNAEWKEARAVAMPDKIDAHETPTFSATINKGDHVVIEFAGYDTYRSDQVQ
jgi:hypothetical protein